jgi:hypothetical protein
VGVHVCRSTTKVQLDNFKSRNDFLTLQLTKKISWQLIVNKIIFKHIFSCSAQIVRIFFINPRPACRETEKGGEGERDTGTTVKGCHQARIARGYLLYLLTGQVEMRQGENPPPLPLSDSLRLQRQISRTASNLEVVSMTADI